MSNLKETGGPSPLTAARLRPASQRMLDHMLTPRLARDRRALPEHLDVDLAHVVMLGERGILRPDEARAILGALEEAAALGDAFPIDPRFDSLVLQVETFLTDRVGEAIGGRMHTGRSRIDHNAAVARLFVRNRLLAVHDGLTALSARLHHMAAEHVGTLMPGWTHLQHAQPWTLGHYLLRQFYLFERDLQRVEEAFARVNLSALGGAALCGTSWPLDRRRVAELLGHDDIVYNSHDAGEFTLDWVMETAALLAIAMVDLGRMAGDLYLWHSWEFDLVEVDDGYCGSSSIMPQKKNAVALEHIRGFAGRALGWFPASAGIARSASSTDCDPAYTGHVLDEATDTTWRCLDLAVGVLESLKIDADEMRRRTGAFWSTASALADAIVRARDLSFRTAHHVVARLVRNAVRDDVTVAAVTGAMLDAAAQETIGRPLGLSTAWAQEQLDPVRFLEALVTEGSPSPREMVKQLAYTDERLQRHRTWREARREQIERGRRLLAEAVRRVRA